MAGRGRPRKDGKPPAAPQRIGRDRGGWRVRAFGPTTGYPNGRVVFKDPETAAWTARTPNRRAGQSLDELFTQVEAALDAGAVTRSTSPDGQRRDLDALAARYLAWLVSEGRDENYIRNRRNLLDVHVLDQRDADGKRYGELLVVEWGPEDTKEWLRRARGRVGAARLEDLGTTLSGLRKTAWRPVRGKRWLPPAVDPMEGAKYSRGSRRVGADRSYIEPKNRPSTLGVRQIIAKAREQARWPWVPLLVGVGSFCGPRLGEQLGLRDIDVDFTRRMLLIRWSVRWPRPVDGVEWAMKPVKTDEQRETPFPGSLHDELLAACAASLGCAATVEAVTVAQQAKLAAKWDRFDAVGLARNLPRPVEDDEGLLFVDAETGRPPTKEQWGDEFRRLRKGTAWSAHIPYRNARHHCATWWDTLRRPDGSSIPDEDKARWLGHSLETHRKHYRLAGEDTAEQWRGVLDAE